MIFCLDIRVPSPEGAGGDGSVPADEEAETFGFRAVGVAPLVAREAGVELVGWVGDRAAAGAGQDLVGVGTDPQADARDRDLATALGAVGQDGDDLAALAVDAGSLGAHRPHLN